MSAHVVELTNMAQECCRMLLFVLILVSALAGSDKGHQEAGEK
jgi:hypothetical protein